MEPDVGRLGRLIGRRIRSLRPVGGGCIARAARAEGEGGPWFVKSGRGDVAASLEAEADGLAFLRAGVGETGIHVPHVVAFEEQTASGPAVLVLEWIEEGIWNDTAWDVLGRGLAAMHARVLARYGHTRDNYIGRLPQVNRPSGDWPTFYRSCRLEPQVERARGGGLWRAEWDRMLERVLGDLGSRLPARPAPARLHGDLWRGNVLVDARGGPVLIDPAVHAGHDETDLAMARLFGGFPPRFFDAYDRARPPEEGREHRLPVYQLYHLLNHLNHFGTGYAGAVDRALRACG